MKTKDLVKRPILVTLPADKVTLFEEVACRKINVKDLKGVEFLNPCSKCLSFRYTVHIRVEIGTPKSFISLFFSSKTI